MSQTVLGWPQCHIWDQKIRDWSVSDKLWMQWKSEYMSVISLLFAFRFEEVFYHLSTILQFLNTVLGPIFIWHQQIVKNGNYYWLFTEHFKRCLLQILAKKRDTVQSCTFHDRDLVHHCCTYLLFSGPSSESLCYRYSCHGWRLLATWSDKYLFQNQLAWIAELLGHFNSLRHLNFLFLFSYITHYCLSCYGVVFLYL